MQYDVGMVLGGGKDSEKILSAHSIARLDKAIELFRLQICLRFILSGGISFSAPATFIRSEASLMCDYMLSNGIPEAFLHLEEKSTDTLGNVYFCRERFLEPNGWHSVLIVTHAFHVDRASYFVKKVLGPSFHVEFISCSAAMEEADEERLLRLERHIKDIYKRWLDTVTDGDSDAIRKILFERHPGHAQNPDFSREQFIRMLYGDRS